MRSAPVAPTATTRDRTREPALSIDPATAERLLRTLGPSLALWRAAEIAALRQVRLERPLLDVGCGDGIVMAQVCRPIEFGVDAEPGAIARAARQEAYQRLIAGPIESAAIEPGSITSAISNSVLEHVTDLNRVLAGIWRVLRPGGRLILTGPTERFDALLLFPASRYGRWRNRALEHRNLLSVAEWQARLRSSGFELEAVRSYLRPALVRLWDALELLQQLWIADRRLFSLVWRRLPDRSITTLAHRLAATDLSAGPVSGGRLIVARKLEGSFDATPH